MTQITAKRVVEALYWLHNNEHNKVECENPKVVGGELTYSHIAYSNYHDKLRVPQALVAEMGKHIRPNKRKFDTRMFALKASGLRLIGQ